MRHTYTILGILTALLVVLPAILPALATYPAIAKAQQQQAAIYTDVDDLNRIISYGMVFKVYIQDDAAASQGITTVKATVYVAGIANYNIVFTFNATSNLYEAQFNISRLGQTDKAEVYVRYYNFTSNTWSSWRKLVGTLAEGNTLVIEYKPYNSTTTIKAVLTYRLADITVKNRLHGNYYWIPRLTDNISQYYAAESEWRLLIPGFTGNTVVVNITIKDLTTNYQVSKNITFVRETGIVFKPANATEAQKITDMLVDISKQLASPWWIKGVDYAHPQYRGDEVVVTATIYASQPITTKTRKLAIFISDAVVEAYATTPTKDIKIVIYDADENLNATGVEQTLQPIELLNASYPYGAVIKTFNLTETGAATGVFVVTFNLLDNPDLWGTVLGPKDNVVDWHFKDLRLDNVALQKGVLFCDKFGSFTVPYHTAKFYIEEESVAIRYAQRCCPIPKITLHIEDADADTGEIVVVRGEVPAGSNIFNVPLYYMRNGIPTTIPGYKITVYVNATNGKDYKLFNVTTAEPLTIAFYSVAPGKLEFDFDLTKLNWTAINEQVTSAGYQIYSIVVIVKDCMAVDSEGKPAPQQLSDSVLVQHVRIELERTTIPVAYKQVGVDVKPGDAQIIRITIYDNGSNVDCCEVDTIPASKIKLELVKVYQGQTAIYVANNSELKIPLYDVNPDGTQGALRGYCYIKVSDLEETGADTGVFKGVIEIYSEINGVRYVGCPSPWLEGAKLYITYVSPSIGSDTAEATFKFLDASIQVVDPDTGEPIAKAVMGTPIRLVIVDPDANLDLAVNESVRVEYTVQGAFGTVTGYLWVKQTVPSSDVFNGTVTLDAINLSEDPLYIDMNLIADNTGHPEIVNTCTGCFTITFTYTDETPYDKAGIQMAEQILPQLVRLHGTLDWLAMLNYQCVQMMQKQVSIEVSPTIGKVTLEYTIDNADIQKVINAIVGSIWQDVTNKTGIPAVNKTLVEIVISDPDQNKYVNNVDMISGTNVWITVEGYPAQITLKSLGINWLNETKANSGTFTATISLEKLASVLSSQIGKTVTAYELAGKKIEVVYQDPMAKCPPTPTACALAAGLAKVYTYGVDATGKITVVDAVTGKPKPFYQCACPFGGACPTGGDVLSINVSDISLIDYYPTQLQAPGTPISILIETLVGVTHVNPNTVSFNAIDIVTEKTSDGVVIPYIVYNAIARLYCFQVAGNNIIVATNGENVTFVYMDPANETGQAVQVTEKISVGTPPVQIPPNKASNVTSVSFYKVEGTRFIPVEVVPAGQPAYMQITLQYDPTVMSQVLQRLGGTGNAFVVIYFIKDASGKLVDYGFKPVAVGDMTVGFGFTLPAPGTYTITVLVAFTADNPVPLSSAYTFTVTAS